MAVATNGAAAASPCLRHAHLLGLLIEAHPVEKFLWAKFKMQGDIMILLSDITLQVKVKLPYTDMMEGLHSSQKCYHLASKHNCHLFGGTLLMWLFRVIRCFNTKSDMYAIFYAGDANGVMEGLSVRLWVGEVEIVRRSIDSDTMKTVMPHVDALH
uniref:Uncharacterized protein n=1 Tax=Oryza nivara TaxID=4536 RepID=A0A0E0G4D8_ORYNI